MSLFFLLPGAGTTSYDLSALTDPVNDQSNGSGTYGVTWFFRVTSDGTVDVTRTFGSNITDDAVYVDPAAGQTLYVRCTQNSGQAFNVGDTLATWHSLTGAQARSFGLSYSASGPDPDLVSYNVDFEIATDSGGTDIVATKAGVNGDVGNTGP